MSNKTQKVRDFLSVHPGSTVTEIYKGTRLNRKRDAEPIVCRLVTRGELEKTKNGKGTHVYTLASAYDRELAREDRTGEPEGF
jgi:hypothetical protein